VSGEVVEVIENYSGAESLEFALTSLPRWVRGNVPMGAVYPAFVRSSLGSDAQAHDQPGPLFARGSPGPLRDVRAPMIAPLILGLVIAFGRCNAFGSSHGARIQRRALRPS